MLFEMLRRLVIVVAVTAGCSDEQVVRLTEIKDEVCACKTPECGGLAMKKIPQREIKSTNRTQQIAREMLDCMAKLNEGERPTTDPDAEVPAPPESGDGSGSASR